MNTQSKRDVAFKTFMDKMNIAEKSVQEQGYFTEEEVEEELARIWNKIKRCKGEAWTI